MPTFGFLKDGELCELKYEISCEQGTLTIDGRTYKCGPDFIELDGRRIPFWVQRNEDIISVWLNGTIHRFETPDPRRRRAGGGQAQLSGGSVKAQMPGKILQVAVSVGDQIESGQNLILMESMKMELSLDATISGTVKTINVQPEQMVAQGALLMEIEEA